MCDGCGESLPIIFLRQPNLRGNSKLLASTNTTSEHPQHNTTRALTTSNNAENQYQAEALKRARLPGGDVRRLLLQRTNTAVCTTGLGFQSDSVPR